MNLRLLSFVYVTLVLKTGHGMPISSFIKDAENGIQLTESKNLSESSNQNNSRLNNITSNLLRTDPVITTTNTIKQVTSPLTFPTTHTQGSMLGARFHERETNVSNTNITRTVKIPLSSAKPTDPRSIKENYTMSTNSPTKRHPKKHQFPMKILGYILIPVGCLLIIAITYCLVRHVQKVRRKKRLERELVHQYSYPNSEADDTEEQNIGDFESIINTQFVAFSDRSDKNLYEDPQAEMSLAFEESSKLVVQEPTSIPDEPEVSTSFTS